MTSLRRHDVSQPGTLPAPGPASAIDLVEGDGAIVWWGSIYGGLMGVGLALTGLALGIGATGIAGDSKSYWYLSRAAGLVAYLLLWGSVIWGLLLSSKLIKGCVKPAVLLDAHQFLSSLALGFALFHGLILLGDRYLSLPLSAILAPFAGSYKPALLAAGQIALWLSLLLMLSFYARKRLGAERWRALHYASFVAYGAALVHAVLIGSESRLPWVVALYVVTAGSVLFLTFYRVLARDQGQRKPKPVIAGR
jgi:predicted ferric reductase